MKAVRCGPRLRPRPRLRFDRDPGRGPTIRTRLALLNTAVLLAGGGVLLALNWVSVHQVLDIHRQVVLPGTVQQPAFPPHAPAETAPAAEAAQVTPAERFEDFRDAVLHDLFSRSLLVLLAVAALSLAAGWWVARRSLSRIGKVTATARHINDANLHDRLALVGPDDEVKELADTFDAMLNRLERAFADQRRFTAQASHELRTPMTVQRTALEIPLAQGRVPADLEPALRRALAATERSERLLASLLALAPRGERHARPASDRSGGPRARRRRPDRRRGSAAGGAYQHRAEPHPADRRRGAARPARAQPRVQRSAPQPPRRVHPDHHGPHRCPQQHRGVQHRAGRGSR
ncbi:histidine kinase dimerization/phospho-acceptor domain-containing protein [Streptomyces sp. NPDC014735]|uniref:histidine kinase dimerization/phospho-acceptor domain-containing protein n=1 Tax=unclassified Streptomyces TaxID=2593676 RepID=UPI003700416C